MEYLEGMKRYADLGIEPPSINWNSLIAYKKQIIGVFYTLFGQVFTGMGIDLLQEHGFLADAHTVMVDDKAYSAEYIIVIGSGSRDSKMPAPGSEYVHMTAATS